MAAETTISWTDHTFNPWRGCAKVHEGCTHCYAEREAKRFPKIRGVWGVNGTRVVASQAMWREPLKWNRAAEAAGERRRVFCSSLADVFEDWRGPLLDHKGNTLLKCESCRNPDGTFYYDSASEYEPLTLMYEHGCGEKMEPLTHDDLRRDLFALIDATEWLDWQLLTKRPENIRRMWPKTYVGEGDFAVEDRGNVWLGTSVSSNESTGGIPHLLKCRALSHVLFLSCEPLLGPVDLSHYLPRTPKAECPAELLPHYNAHFQLGWIIVGGESGPNRRDCGLEAIADLVEQCRAAGVPCFVKQDCAAKSGQQGRIPDEIWAAKEFPREVASA